MPILEVKGWICSIYATALSIAETKHFSATKLIGDIASHCPGGFRWVTPYLVLLQLPVFVLGRQDRRASFADFNVQLMPRL